MEAIGPKTLSLMTEAVFNYIHNLSLKHSNSIDIRIKNQFADCLTKLEVLKEISCDAKLELKKAA